MSSLDVYLFVISSLNDPIYRKIQQKRKRLLKHYGIPYTVLINHEESKLDDLKVPTLVPLEEEEILYNGHGYNPYMAQKFLMAVKMYFRSFQHYEDIPNYIVRINATVYIHYPSLLKILHDKDFPRTRVLAGPNWGSFVQGMIMVFSKDVIVNMLNDNRIYSKEIMVHNDDVSLSIIAQPYCEWIDWNKHLCTRGWGCQTNEKGVLLPDKIKPLENEKWIFRICEFEDNRKIDEKNWDVLLEYFNELPITTPLPELPSSKAIPIFSSETKQLVRSSSCLQSCLLWFVLLIVVSCLAFKMMSKNKKLMKRLHKLLR